MLTSLPHGLVQRGQTRVFTQDDIPAALLCAHDLKSDRWGVLELMSGSVTFVDLVNGTETKLKAPASHAIAPVHQHHLRLEGPMTCQITFFGPPDATDED